MQPVRHASIHAAANKVIDNLRKVGKENLSLEDVPAADRDVVSRAVGGARTFSLAQVEKAIHAAAVAIEQADSNWSLFHGGRNGMAEEFEVKRAAGSAPAATPLALRVHQFRAAESTANAAAVSATGRELRANDVFTSGEVTQAVDKALQHALGLPINTTWIFARDRFQRHGAEDALKALDGAKDALDRASSETYQASAALAAARALQPGNVGPFLKTMHADLARIPAEAHTPQTRQAQQTVARLLDAPANAPRAREQAVALASARNDAAQQNLDAATRGLREVVVLHARSLVNMQQAPDDAALLAERKAAGQAADDATTAAIQARFGH